MSDEKKRNIHMDMIVSTDFDEDDSKKEQESI